MSGLWRCSCCGEAMPATGFEDSSWRWDGARYQHKCPGIDPQAGHFDCEWFGDGHPDGPPLPPPDPPPADLDELDRLHAGYAAASEAFTGKSDGSMSRLSDAASAWGAASDASWPAVSAELRRLRALVESLAVRCADQSEALTRLAAKKGGGPWTM